MDAPAYFDLDDDGKVVVLRSDVAEDDRADVEAAVEECPMAALRLEEQDD
jgi:3-phenylpropionate/trans-cinnamate dioxygenase ferredoxin reductase subunit